MTREQMMAEADQLDAQAAWRALAWLERGLIGTGEGEPKGGDR